jgi:hypothetical protein
MSVSNAREFTVKALRWHDSGIAYTKSIPSRYDVSMRKPRPVFSSRGSSFSKDTPKRANLVLANFS